MESVFIYMVNMLKPCYNDISILVRAGRIVVGEKKWLDGKGS